MKDLQIFRVVVRREGVEGGGWIISFRQLAGWDSSNVLKFFILLKTFGNSTIFYHLDSSLNGIKTLNFLRQFGLQQIQTAYRLGLVQFFEIFHSTWNFWKFGCFLSFRFLPQWRWNAKIFKTIWIWKLRLWLNFSQEVTFSQ